MKTEKKSLFEKNTAVVFGAMICCLLCGKCYSIGARMRRDRDRKQGKQKEITYQDLIRDRSNYKQ